LHFFPILKENKKRKKATVFAFYSPYSLRKMFKMDGSERFKSLENKHIRAILFLGGWISARVHRCALKAVAEAESGRA
jgi:hypothetical protein